MCGKAHFAHVGKSKYVLRCLPGGELRRLWAEAAFGPVPAPALCGAATATAPAVTAANDATQDLAAWEARVPKPAAVLLHPTRHCIRSASLLAAWLTCCLALLPAHCSD